MYCDCDASKKCNGVEKLPYAPTVQVMRNDMVRRLAELNDSDCDACTFAPLHRRCIVH